MAFQQLNQVLPMFGRHSCLIVGSRRAAILTLKLIGNEQVDPVWFSLSLLIDLFLVSPACAPPHQERRIHRRSSRQRQLTAMVEANNGKSIPKRLYRADFIYLFLFGLVLR